MSPSVYLAAAIWVPLVGILFTQLPKVRAVLISLLAGWMFLPVYQFTFPGLPDISKEFLTCVPPLLMALLLWDREAGSFRCDVMDVLVVVFCFTMPLSSIYNHLGTYDAVSALIASVPVWACPYLLGRLFLGSPDAMRQFMWAMLIAGLVYVPICVWEIRMSPQFHSLVYGFHQKSLLQSMRGGTWRPNGFMHTGLMLGMWMMAASFCGIQLWRNGLLKRPAKLPSFLSPKVLVAGLVLVFVACKSFGAVLLLAAGCGVLELARRTRRKTVLYALVLLPAAVLVMRVAPTNYEEGLVKILHRINPVRASSLDYRFNNEELLFARAMERPLLGWGRHGAGFIYDDSGMKTSVTDSFWIILVNTQGFLALVLFFLLVLIPSWRLLRRLPAQWWASPSASLPLAVSLLLPLYAIDCLVNDMKIPIYMLVAGGLTSILQHGELLEREPGQLKPPEALGAPQFRYI